MVSQRYFWRAHCHVGLGQADAHKIESIQSYDIHWDLGPAQPIVLRMLRLVGEMPRMFV
jgi:hypothetical protein